MSTPNTNLQELTSKLRPHLEVALNELSKFGELVAADFSKKAASGIAGLTVTSVRSIGIAAINRIKSSRAHKSFQNRWDTARTDRAKDDAIRSLLSSDPVLALSLRTLLTKRDLVRAVLEHCEHLPHVELLDPSRRLSDLYVPSLLQAVSPHGDSTTNASFLTDHTPINSDTSKPARVELASGNHLIEGPAGSGKSTLIRHVIISAARNIIENPSTVSFEDVRIPILVGARTLHKSRFDFSSSLRAAVVEDMSLAGLGPLPDDLFDIYSDTGHPLWLVGIDGLDEINDANERQHVWDAICNLHSQIGDSFTFVVTSRPAAAHFGDNAAHFRRWSVLPMSERDRRSLARNYIRDTEKADHFLARIDAQGLSSTVNTPLFEAIAASVFATTGELPTKKYDLCDAFSFALLEKTFGPASPHCSVTTTLLSEIAASNDLDFDRLANDPDISKAIPRALPRLRIAEHLNHLVTRTGLVRLSGRRYDFLHDILRSFFLSAKLARQFEPDSEVWSRIDPYVAGWSTVEFLCERWARNGKNIADAVKALLDFGNDGHHCVSEVAAGLDKTIVPDRILHSVVEKIEREMFSTGPTVSHINILTTLARRRLLVKSTLIRISAGDHDFCGSRLQCAECLLNAGWTEDGLRIVKRIALGDDEYEGDRSHAAELLLKHGVRDAALPVLRALATDADELGIQSQAAVILCEQDDSPQNREMLREIIGSASVDSDEIYETTLERILVLGEKDIALPHLRRRAKLDQSEKLNFLTLNRKIADCKIIAAHHDKQEGVAALRALLAQAWLTLRDKAEILDALSEFCEPQDISTFVSEEHLLEGDLDSNADWFVLEFLIKLHLRVDAIAFGVRLLDKALTDRYRTATKIIGQLLEILDRTEITDLIKPKLLNYGTPEACECLAKIGFRDEALRRLRLLDKAPPSIQVSAAEVLCKIGARNVGLKRLIALVKNQNNEFKIRFDAANAADRIGDTRSAKKLFSHLLRDETLSIEERCQTAKYFDFENAPETKVVWDILMPVVSDRTLPIATRARAAQELLHTSESEDSEFEHLDVIDEVVFLLDNAETSLEKLALASVLANVRWKISEIPNVLEALKDEAVDLSRRVAVLTEFSVFAEDGIANKELHRIAAMATTPYSLVIEALKHTDTPESAALLESLARNPTVPPEWRIEVAKSFRWPRSRTPAPMLLSSIAEDDSIGMRFRIAALEAWSGGRDEKVKILTKIKLTTETGNWERLLFAEAAIGLCEWDLARAALHDATRAQPLSISEIAEIAENFKALGDLDDAKSLIKSLTLFPDIVLQETEDHWTTVEAAKLLATLGDKSTALEFLQRLSKLSTEWSLECISEAIRDLTGMGDSDSGAAAVSDSHLSIANLPPEVQSPHSDVFDDSLPLPDRLPKASDLVSKAGDRKALHLIWEVARDQAADPNDRLQAIEILDDLGFRGASQKLLQEISNLPTIDSWWLADQFLRFGNKAEALIYFRRSIERSPPEYADQIARRLAELQDVTGLQAARARFAT